MQILTAWINVLHFFFRGAGGMLQTPSTKLLLPEPVQGKLPCVDSGWNTQSGPCIPPRRFKSGDSPMQKMMTVETPSLNGITFDGNDLWISDIEEKMMKKVSIAEQRVRKEIKFLPGGIPKAITFANDSLVVANYDLSHETSSELIQINVMNGNTLRTLLCPEQIDSGICYDESYFWGCSSKDKELIRFCPSTGEVLKTLPMERIPCGLCFDGTNLIVAFAKEGRKKTAGIALISPETGEILKEEKIDVPIGGVTFAEDMIFYTNTKLKEIQVTRIKV